ncbi:lectin-like protein [Myxococcus landrumensis]|uniref:C-type lectin domain-containing protein n=1 Tax=Myxococcus landrumensis TaxID=2813577 RepID=A0ABX7N1E7_9BACT|nr:lectin-like protein [Myxococcus landrumus]QSQ12537.1 hypothetical protein JY572_29845 [Myxococcus landrumus]
MSGVPTGLRAALSFLVVAGWLACHPPQEQEVETSAVESVSQASYRDLWAARVARIQQSLLQADVPLPHVQRIGSHNSHVTTTYTNCRFLWDCYYARANQHRGIDVQLLSGVRNLAIDAWSGPDTYWAKACSNDSDDDGAPCFHHEGERFSTSVDDVMKHIGKWLTAPENQDEVLVIWLEDNFHSHDSRAWFLDDFARYVDKDYPDTTKSLTGDLIFGPSHLATYFHGQWPTPRQLVAMGKRVIVSVKNRQNYTTVSIGGVKASELLFNESDIDQPGWPKNGEFTGYPSCSYSGRSTPMGLRWTEFSELKITDHFELPQRVLGWKELDVAGAVACGFSVTLDHVEADPDRTAQNDYRYYDSTMKPAVWSFYEGEPNDTSGNEDCAEVMASVGRWNDLSCEAVRKYACKKNLATSYGPDAYDPSFWFVTGTSGKWSGGFTACPEGYSFLPPVNGWEAKKLANVISGTSNSVWINFTDRYQEGTWGVDRYANWSAGEPNNAGGNERCAETLPNGAWNDTACSDLRRHACKRVESCASGGACPQKWVLSQEGSWWWQNCPVGYTFAAPETATENAELLAVTGGARVWVNRSNFQDASRWEPGTYTAWDTTEPNNYNGNEHCASMVSNGSWWDEACSLSRRLACRKSNMVCTTAGCPEDLWTLSSVSRAWGVSAPQAECPQGYAFKAPRNDAENTALKKAAAGQQVWLNFTDQGNEGAWSSWGPN